MSHTQYKKYETYECISNLNLTAFVFMNYETGNSTWKGAFPL